MFHLTMANGQPLSPRLILLCGRPCIDLAGLGLSDACFLYMLKSTLNFAKVLKIEYGVSFLETKNRDNAGDFQASSFLRVKRTASCIRHVQIAMIIFRAPKLNATLKSNHPIFSESMVLRTFSILHLFLMMQYFFWGQYIDMWLTQTSRMESFPLEHFIAWYCDILQPYMCFSLLAEMLVPISSCLLVLGFSPCQGFPYRDHLYQRPAYVH